MYLCSKNIHGLPSYILKELKQGKILPSIISVYFSGVWNVPYMTGAYLVHGYLMPVLTNAYNSQTDLDPDMAFCKTLRDKVNYFPKVQVQITPKKKALKHTNR